MRDTMGDDFLDDGEVIFVDPTFGGTGMGAPGGAEALVGVFFFFFVVMAIFAIVVGVRKYRILKDAGTDPFTVDAAVAAKVLKSDMLAPASAETPTAKSIEQRLAELDDLLSRGLISADEHRDARAAVLRS